MSNTSESFITYICLLTHDVADKEWYKGAGFYGCIKDGHHSEWQGPYVDTQAARYECGDIRVHSPARGSRSGS
jgi:hypothetical protein